MSPSVKCGDDMKTTCGDVMKVRISSYTFTDLMSDFRLRKLTSGNERRIMAFDFALDLLIYLLIRKEFECLEQILTQNRHRSTTVLIPREAERGTFMSIDLL